MLNDLQHHNYRFRETLYFMTDALSHGEKESSAVEIKVADCYTKHLRQ